MNNLSFGVAVSKTIPSRSRGGGGLSNVLGQLNKKNKLSTLEKSKLDWDTFKKEEDIEAEIQSHNKGKQGLIYFFFTKKILLDFC